MSKETIRAGLLARGYSEKATAAIMGNMVAESALKSNNVEDRCPYQDEYYTALVDSGGMSWESFIRDTYGYGLCQWTWWSRKDGLLDLARSRGVSIADEETQLDYIGIELHRDFPDVLACLMGDGSVAEMTACFMRRFENPATQSAAAIHFRVDLAEEIYEEMLREDGPSEAPTPAEAYWPPRMVDKGMSGPDVCVLQALLTARGYYTAGISGTIDETTDQAIRAYQRDAGLAADGVAGPKTWESILEI